MDLNGLVTVHCCCAHFMKMISDKLHDQGVTHKPLNRFIKSVIAKMTIQSDLKEIDVLFR